MARLKWVSNRMKWISNGLERVRLGSNGFGSNVMAFLWVRKGSNGLKRVFMWKIGN